jgi:hypothetical protein
MENEMWYLLYNIVRAGKEYEKYDRKIGDVQPSNIVINEDGQTKIISMDSWPGQEDNFEKVAASRQNKAFLGKNYLTKPPRNALNSSSEKEESTRLGSTAISLRPLVLGSPFWKLLP